MKKILLLAVVFFCFIPEAHAANCSYRPFTVGQTLTAAALNARFNQVTACTNGGLGDANVSADEPLGVTKVAANQSWSATSFVVPCATSTEAAVWRLPAAGAIRRSTARCRGCSAADIDVRIRRGSTAVHTHTLTDEAVSQTALGSTAVVASDDLSVRVTQNTGGSCVDVTVVVWYSIEHTSP